MVKLSRIAILLCLGIVLVQLGTGISFAGDKPTGKQTSVNVININKASVDQLKQLPGIGDSIAAKIVAYRDKNGKFKTIDDLKKVKGIGDKKFEKIKALITVK